jgi:hypothetical protein
MSFTMAITLLAPALRIANAMIARRIIEKIRDAGSDWRLAEQEIRLALDAASTGRSADCTT